MKIAAIVGVKDEYDLIQPCLERLWAVGVGPILVLDDHSVDGTREVVGRLVSRSPAPLALSTFSADFAQNMLVDGSIFGPFIRQHSPDWLLCIDADEFLICINDDLPSVLAGAASPVLSIERFNIPLTNDPFVPMSGAEARDFLGIRLITGTEVLSRELLDEPLGRRWIRHRILPKLACRPDRVARFGLGWHSVADSQGLAISAVAAQGIIIAHLPMTTLERFFLKVGNAREFFRKNGEIYSGDAAWHWKRWVDLADRGLLDVEFEAQRMGEGEIQRFVDLGAIERADAVLEKSVQTTSKE